MADHFVEVKSCLDGTWCKWPGLIKLKYKWLLTPKKQSVISNIISVVPETDTSVTG